MSQDHAMPDASPASAYQHGKTQGDAALRSSLLDEAGSILLSDGSEALTMRRLAAASGCSTTVLYRLFDNKNGIVRGLYREGFDRLRQRLASLPATNDPMQHLSQLAHAYREHALTESAYYLVMFSHPVPQFEPTDDDIAHGRNSLQLLVDAVARARAGGHLAGPDPQHIAHVLWAAAHGAVSLQLTGQLAGDEAAHVFTDLTTAAIRQFTPPPHDPRSREPVAVRG